MIRLILYTFLKPCPSRQSHKRFRKLDFHICPNIFLFLLTEYLIILLQMLSIKAFLFIIFLLLLFNCFIIKGLKHYQKKSDHQKNCMLLVYQMTRFVLIDFNASTIYIIQSIICTKGYSSYFSQKIKDIL